MRIRWSSDPEALLVELAERQINYAVAEVGSGWCRDDHERLLGYEEAGPPVLGGVFARAVELVRGYEFAPPELIRGHFRRGSALLGRDMVLEGRFCGARFLMGVRVTAVLDTVDAQVSRWGWAYETLVGHLERGRVDYEVSKDHVTGAVRFRAHSYSRPSHESHPILRVGWAIFGRRLQLRFYRRVGEQMAALAAHHTITTAPTTRIHRPRRALTIVDGGNRTLLPDG
ncbi:uncharacterized protein (UPF0548 family) [Actinokineospora baliensis]|uniref:DUF1990 family protein n=1 Tax=Actinokineospora baliensis TaxID=547056 RepID=UPI00195B5207|nr:DUF1990 family protein [Actinokineospora baliensis]MBM7774103.1 uncharacterized protein (UPF0548 family) [Actinokineospora baliensis]